MANKKKKIEPKSNSGEAPISDMEFVLSDKFIDIYANSSQVTITKWDVQFVFGLILSAKATQKPQIEQRVAVMMSHQHAKAFFDLIKTQVENMAKLASAEQKSAAESS